MTRRTTSERYGVAHPSCTLWIGTFRPRRSATLELDLRTPADGIRELRVELEAD